MTSPGIIATRGGAERGGLSVRAVNEGILVQNARLAALLSRKDTPKSDIIGHVATKRQATVRPINFITRRLRRLMTN